MRVSVCQHSFFFVHCTSCLSSCCTGFDTYVRNLNVYLHNLRAEEEVLFVSPCQCFFVANVGIQEAKAKKKSAPQPGGAGGTAQ
jgi:hypothetical protein